MLGIQQNEAKTNKTAFQNVVLIEIKPVKNMELTATSISTLS